MNINVSDSNNSEVAGYQADDASKRILDLSMADREILLKACRMYRASIPIYLQSKQGEIQRVDNIIRKLT